jgi:hypothetical protein
MNRRPRSTRRKEGWTLSSPLSAARAPVTLEKPIDRGFPSQRLRCTYFFVSFATFCPFRIGNRRMPCPEALLIIDEKCSDSSSHSCSCSCSYSCSCSKIRGWESTISSTSTTALGTIHGQDGNPATSWGCRFVVGSRTPVRFVSSADDWESGRASFPARQVV